jgi:hypothetical protein
MAMPLSATLIALMLGGCTVSWGSPNEESQPASALAMLEHTVNELQAEILTVAEQRPSCPAVTPLTKRR